MNFLSLMCLSYAFSNSGTDVKLIMDAGRSFHWLITLCEKKVLRIVVFDLFLYIFRVCPLVILSFSLKNMFGSMSIYPLKILNVNIISPRERLYTSVGRSRERKRSSYGRSFIARTNFVALLCTLSRDLMCFNLYGFQTEPVNSSIGRTKLL